MGNDSLTWENRLKSQKKCIKKIMRVGEGRENKGLGFGCPIISIMHAMLLEIHKKLKKK